MLFSIKFKTIHFDFDETNCISIECSIYTFSRLASVFERNKADWSKRGSLESEMNR